MSLCLCRVWVPVLRAVPEGRVSMWGVSQASDDVAGLVS